ncbi:MAG: 23S ribosomal protein [Candidatus Giovannonibacteria bacterium GW2011_GWC2_43_8]|nr:MAG: 23S ribosomal protein [Candidatus Giovannonibacteria bacterium GW2011_GWC2_43_8]
MLFPTDERYGLVAQIRRASVSIVSNIAEGFGRRTQAEKNRFFDMAIGSVCEVQSQLLISKDLFYIPTDEFQKINDQSVTVHKIINGLIQRSI